MKGKDLTERIYCQIKRDLMMCKLPSSELFSEQMLADRYNCSRTPAREAAGRLVSEGFLNKYPSKGYIVRLPTEREMSEMRYCLYSLETAALRLTVHTAYLEEFHSLMQLLDREINDPEIAYFSNMTFHYELAKLSRNDTLVSLIERLYGLMIRGESSPTYRGVPYLGDSFPDKRENFMPMHGDPNETERHKAIVQALIESRREDAMRLLISDIYPTVDSGKINMKAVVPDPGKTER